MDDVLHFFFAKPFCSKATGRTTFPPLWYFLNQLWTNNSQDKLLSKSLEPAGGNGNPCRISPQFGRIWHIALYSFLNNNYSNNELEDFHDLKTVGDYYGSYFSPVKCIFINSVSIKDNSSSSSGNESGSSESTSGSQSSSSNSNSQEPKELENKGKLLIIKNAKKLLTLNEEESDNLNLFNPKVKRDNFTVKNYSEGHLKNADILFNVLNKLYSTQAYFKDGKPYYKINLKLYVRTGEVISQNLTQKDYAVLQEDFSPKLISKMQEEVLRNLKSAENNFKENNYDVIDCYAWFLKTRNKELKAYLKTLKNPEEFIKNVNFEYNIQFVQSY